MAILMNGAAHTSWLLCFLLIRTQGLGLWTLAPGVELLQAALMFAQNTKRKWKS